MLKKIIKKIHGLTLLIRMCKEEVVFRDIFMCIIGQDPSVSKSNWLHVVIFRFSLLIKGIFYRFLSKMGDYSEVLNFDL